MKKALMVVALLLAMSASAFAVTRAEVREQWVEKRDGVVFEDREKTTSMLLPEYNAGILAEQRRLRQELLGDKKKKVEGAIPEIKRIFKDLAETGEQALRESTAAIDNSAAAARENVAETAKLGKKVDGMHVSVLAVGENIGDQITRNIWVLVLVIVLATAIILIAGSRTVVAVAKPAAARFDTVDTANAEILAVANRVSSENADILKAVKEVAATVSTIHGATPPPAPPTTP